MSDSSGSKTNPWASRFNAGDRTEIGFFGPPGSRVFGCLNLPSGRPLGGVVICPPLHADFAKNYRNEVLLGRRLARGGFAVLRFHYRGHGHSDGDASRITLESMKGDVDEAIAHLQATTDVEQLGLVGCRLGGFVAAAAAASFDGARLAVWEPVFDPARYLREALRARLIGDLKGSSRAESSSSSPMDRLNRQGFVDIHGYPIHLDLVKSLEGRTLVGELGERPRPVLLVRISRSSELSREYRDPVDRWTSLGFEIEIHRIPGEVGWWFRGAAQDRDDANRLAVDGVRKTSEWMSTRFALLKESS